MDVPFIKICSVIISNVFHNKYSCVLINEYINFLEKFTCHLDDHSDKKCLNNLANLQNLIKL